MTLSEMAQTVLETADPHEKARLTHFFTRLWRDDPVMKIGSVNLPGRPARPEKPDLKPPNQMPRRRNTVSLLHALAHIELNAIDLAWDIMARFTNLAEENAAPGSFSLPCAFYDDWVKVADDEAKHFLMLGRRLNDLDAAYGDLPAHDGLWEASEKTAHDFAARLAIVPMVLEARGLDVTPGMVAAMKAQGDEQTAAILQTIHDDEITHVRAGTVWFESWCAFHGHDVETTWQDLVRAYFNGKLKPPFNDDSREKAGMVRDWYEPLAPATNAAMPTGFRNDGEKVNKNSMEN